MKHLQKMELGFSLTQIKFIAAQVILALECLHSHKIIHKDIKPENILLDEEGYIRLCDFNLSKHIGERKDDRVVGTLEYMAPEVIFGAKDQSYEIDWWGLGILLYELYYKRTPFVDENPDEIRRNIKKMSVSFSTNNDEKNEKTFKRFQHLIKKLLKKNPK